MVEGAVMEVPAQGGRKHPHQEHLKIDTTNILFIVGGSFEGIDEVIKKRQKEERLKKHEDSAGIGFGSYVDSKEQDKKKKFNETILNVEAADLRKFGMLPEFVGRFPVIAPLQELTEEEMVKILTEPKNALVKQYKALLAKDGVELIMKDDALKEIAKKAIERKTGARGLRSIMEELLIDHMYDIPDNPNIKAIIINKSCVTQKRQPLFKYHTEEVCANQ